MSYEFSKDTDQHHDVRVQSWIISASWVRNRVYAGYEAELEVRTAFVGQGAPIEITAKTEDGYEGGRLKDKVWGPVFKGKIKLAGGLSRGSLVFFKVKLPESGGIEAESNRVPVLRPPRISNLRWSDSEARREDILILTADVKDVPSHQPAKVHIMEHDQDGAHDPITTLDCEIVDEKLEVRWRFEYHEDTDDYPNQDDLDPYGNSYLHPEYFFVVDVDGFRVGDEQEPGLLRFQDFIEIRLVGDQASVGENEEYVLHLADGSERRGQLDARGRAREEDVPPGPYVVRFPNLM